MIKNTLIFSLVFSNLLNILFFTTVNATQYTNVKLKHCYDGDTCRFFINGVNTSVRLAGIDAPEIKQPYGKQSRDVLYKVLYSKNIILNCTGKSYKRKVCSVYIKPSVGKYIIDVQEVMVLNGYAWDSPKYSKGKYHDVMNQAQNAKRGLWSQAHPQLPSDFRKKNGIIP